MLPRRYLRRDAGALEGTAALSIRRPRAGGESLDPHQADRIFALDERLTRQFEKTLAMMIRLREMRAACT